MAELNETIHQTVRLRIMAALVTLEPADEVDFTYLRDLLEVTDGNLGAHLRKLEEEMLELAKDLEFERAAAIRDEIRAVNEMYKPDSPA